MSFKNVWSSAVDGAFTGGKWGMRIGGVLGVVNGLGAPPEVAGQYFAFSFGAAVAFGVEFAIGGMLLGAAVGGVVGAVRGLMKDSPAEHHAQPRQPTRAKEQERARAPQQALPEPEMPPPAPPAPAAPQQAAPVMAQNFQNIVIQSRSPDIRKFR